MDLTAYSNLYDFAAIESAVQDYFIADGGLFVEPPDETDANRETWAPADGEVPFMTAFQASLFQKFTPRVACFLTGINRVQPVRYVADNNGAMRANQYQAGLTFETITAPSYADHTALRNRVMALVDMLVPPASDVAAAIGVNQYLTGFQLVQSAPQNLDTSIQTGDGFYGSQLSCQIIFSIPPEVIAAVVES